MEPQHEQRAGGRDGASVAQWRLQRGVLDPHRLLAALAGPPDLLARTTVIFLGDNGTLDSATVPPFDPGARGRQREEQIQAIKDWFSAWQKKRRGS